MTKLASNDFFILAVASDLKQSGAKDLAVLTADQDFYKAGKTLLGADVYYLPDKKELTRFIQRIT